MPLELLPDQVINNYRVVRKLGSGGMGAVFEVIHVQIGRRAAIKVLSFDAQRQPELVARFLNEARAANQVRHPGVVQVFEYGQLPDGTPWMLMELLGGRTLDARLESQGCPVRLPRDSALPILQQLAEILTSTHSHGIIHRDLKPSNIMLLPDRLVLGGERVKLLDFGIAKLLDPPRPGEPGTPRTETGKMLGTVHYMAPEQVKSAGTVDGRADVYALGVIAYQALSGVFPVYDSNSWALLVKKVTEPALPLRQQAPELPQDLCELVMSMLAREPQQRPSMAKVEDSLSRMLGLRGWGPAEGAAPAQDAPRQSAENDLSSTAPSSPAPANLTRVAPVAGASRLRWLLSIGSLPLLFGVLALGKVIFGSPTRYPTARPTSDLATWPQPDLLVAPADLSARPGALPPERNDLAVEPPSTQSKKTDVSLPQQARAIPSCVRVAISEACIYGDKNLTSETQARIVAAFTESKIKLCSNDTFEFLLGPSGVKKLSAPAHLSSLATEGLLWTMRGKIDNQPSLSQVTIRCKAK